jgi:hypothetical protein
MSALDPGWCSGMTSPGETSPALRKYNILSVEPTCSSPLFGEEQGFWYGLHFSRYPLKSQPLCRGEIDRLTPMGGYLVHLPPFWIVEIRRGIWGINQLINCDEGLCVVNTRFLNCSKPDNGLNNCKCAKCLQILGITKTSPLKNFSN